MLSPLTSLCFPFLYQVLCECDKFETREENEGIKWHYTAECTFINSLYIQYKYTHTHTHTHTLVNLVPEENIMRGKHSITLETIYVMQMSQKGQEIL